MASRKGLSAPEWQVILERIESQNRMTIEAVEVNRAVLGDRIGALEGHLGGRMGNLETAVTGLAQRTGNVETAVTGLTERTGTLETAVQGLVGRFDAFEKRTA